MYHDLQRSCTFHCFFFYTWKLMNTYVYLFFKTLMLVTLFGSLQTQHPTPQRGQLRCTGLQIVSIQCSVCSMFGVSTKHLHTSGSCPRRISSLPYGASWLFTFENERIINCISFQKEHETLSLWVWGVIGPA